MIPDITNMNFFLKACHLKVVKNKKCTTTKKIKVSRWLIETEPTARRNIKAGMKTAVWSPLPCGMLLLCNLGGFFL